MHILIQRTFEQCRFSGPRVLQSKFRGTKLVSRTLSAFWKATLWLSNHLLSHARNTEKVHPDPWYCKKTHTLGHVFTAITEQELERTSECRVCHQWGFEIHDGHTKKNQSPETWKFLQLRFGRLSILEIPNNFRQSGMPWPAAGRKYTTSNLGCFLWRGREAITSHPGVAATCLSVWQAGLKPTGNSLYTAQCLEKTLKCVFSKWVSSWEYILAFIN